MKDLHRGDIYEIKVQPSWGFPHVQTTTVMILQNDAGEIPCSTVTVLPVTGRRPFGARNSHRCSSWKQNGSIYRADKRQLKAFLGRLSAEHAGKLIEELERKLETYIPEVIEAP